ncbi:MAG: DNA-processing protein DprA [Saccharofermentanales bacterium]
MNDYEENLESAIWISRLSKYSSLNGNVIKKSLEYFGSMKELHLAGHKELLEIIGGPPDKILKAGSYMKNDDNRRQAAQEAAACCSLYGDAGMKAICVIDPDYPKKLKEISAAPAILYYCSHQSISRLNDGSTVAIVGTRTPSPYGLAATERIVRGFTGVNINVISGMARGIDSYAHQNALRCGIFTAAVLGCGLDIIYPPENKELMLRIIENGVVLSECPPGTFPARSCFPARNRIISGISDCVVVCEASAKSGTMITAGFAADQGRDVYAIPGSIFSPQSSGTNKLIQDGAMVLTRAEDILGNMAGLKYQYLQTLFNDCVLSDENPAFSKSVSDDFPEEGIQPDTVRKKCRELLRNMEMSIEEIAAAIALPVETVSGILSMEELSGEVICRNGRFILTEPYKSSIK